MNCHVLECQPFLHLRASRDTDLSEFLPDHVVASLMGNTEKTSKLHYKMLTPGQRDALEHSVISPPMSPYDSDSTDSGEVGDKDEDATAESNGNESNL